MKGVKKFLLILFLMPLLHGAAQAQTNEERVGSMSFLKLNGSAGMLALGDIHASGRSSFDLLRINPAAVLTHDRQIGFSHTILPTEGNLSYAGAYTTTEDNILWGISALILRNGELELRTSPTDDPDGTSIPQNSSVALSAAFDLMDSLRVGVSAKWLNEKLVTYNADGYAIDFGLHYHLSEEYSVAVALNDLGSMGKLKNEASALPARATISLYAIPSFIKSEDWSTDILASAQFGFDDKTSHLAFGAAENYRDWLTVRAGYLTGNSTRGLSFGASVAYKGIALEYAFAPSMNGFNSTNVFGISVKL